MMQWTPYGTSEADLKDHIRTFASVFPEVIVVKGAGGYGFYMLGFMAPHDARSLPRSGRCWTDPASSPTSRAPSIRRRSTVDGWVTVIDAARRRRGCRGGPGLCTAMAR